MVEPATSDGALGPRRSRLGVGGFLGGPAGAALAHREFRVLLMGTTASNIGTWMQNVLLGVYGLQLTHSATYVGLLYFAQLGPLLVFSTVGGALADIIDRRRLVLLTQLQQLAFSLVLAFAVASGRPAPALLFGCVLLIGIGNAIGAPALNALMPNLVPREALAGAISLQSVQQNLARVIGPPLGVGLYALTDASTVFTVNAGTYLFAIMAIVRVVRPRGPATPDAAGPLTRLKEGLRIAANDPLLRRVFTTLVTLSFFSVSFVGLMPVIADANLGMNPGSFEFGVLFAMFGLGAALGAASVGSWLASIPPARLVRPALVAWAVLLAGFAIVRVPWAAFVIVPMLGYAYLLLMTSMSTIVQIHVDDSVRGRVFGLWFMGWGGVAPLGVLFGGALANATSVTLVMVLGAVVALLLSLYADFVRVGAPG